MSFSDLGLTPELLRAVADQGYTEPTPVQSEAIPLVLAGRDLLAGAQTGTGKTAAFVLPILQLLNATRTAGGNRRNEGESGDARGLRGVDGRREQRVQGPPVRALVVTPTRELCLQIEESVRTYGAHRRIRSVAIYGGVGYASQNRALRAGPGIVVATPGRLLDHIEQGHIDLSGLEIFVLDEADRMLDMGFIRDIRKLIALLPKNRQTLLFSATFSEDIRELAHRILRVPVTVQVTPPNTPTELVTQLVIRVDRERKRDLLSHLIRSGRIEQALVFARTKHGANRLADQLARDGIAATAIHGNKSQGQRVRALDDFKAGRASILVATEVASRGLDIEQLPHVVNYELPMVAEDYVHRIGRTGRAGATGDAISLVSADEAPLLREIERLLGRPIPTEVIPGFERDRSSGRQPIRQPFGPRSVPDTGRAGASRAGGARRVSTEPGRPGSATVARRRSGAHGHSLTGSGIGNRNVLPRGGPARPARPAGFVAAEAGDRRGAPASGRGFSRPPGDRPRPAGSPDGSWPRRPAAGPGRPDGRRFEPMPGERFARSGDPRR